MRVTLTLVCLAMVRMSTAVTVEEALARYLPKRLPQPPPIVPESEPDLDQCDLINCPVVRTFCVLTIEHPCDLSRIRCEFELSLRI